jgi:thioredoxin 1
MGKSLLCGKPKILADALSRIARAFSRFSLKANLSTITSRLRTFAGTDLHFPILGPSMSEHIIHVSDETFDDEVLKSGTPVLVDFWAEWCGPCKMIAPTLEDIARDYSGRLKVAKVNVDQNQATPPKYGIRGIPTLILFKNGNAEATKVGAVSKSQLTAFIDSNI